MRSALLRLLTAIGIATATTTVASAAPAFEEGSSDALSRRVFHAQNLEYARVLAEFDDHLQHNPKDAIAAVERCRFIDVFAYAEDSQNEQAVADSDACHEALASGPLGSTPQARLFAWESQWGEEGIATGNALLTQSGPWNRAQLAKLHESLSVRYRSVDLLKSGEHALTAVNLDPSSDSRLFAAQHLVRIGARARAVEMIRAMPAEKWRTWTLKSALDTLLDMGEPGSALDLVRANQDLALDAATRARLARVLHASGKTDEALEQMHTLGQDPPTGAAGLSLRRQIFEFQLEHGTRDDAVAAYRTLRDGGYHADPYGHSRLSLFLRYPAAPWHADELLGIGALTLLLVVLGLLPLIIVAPLHYWSLARRVRMGAHANSDDTPWGFGHLWYALAVISVAGGLATYLGSYDQFRDWFGLDAGVTSALTSGIADDRELGRAFLYTQLLTLVGLLPLALRSGMRKGLLGTWSLGHSACAGIGLAFLLLMANGIVKVATSPAIALGGDTIRAMQGIYGLYGTGGLLLVSAIAAPLVEEFVFRGIFLRVAARHVRFWIAAALQGAVFIALHDQAGAYLSLFALALVAAWLAHRSGGLIAPIALHATNNVMASLAIMGVTRSVSVVPG